MLKLYQKPSRNWLSPSSFLGRYAKRNRKKNSKLSIFTIFLRVEERAILPPKKGKKHTFKWPTGYFGVFLPSKHLEAPFQSQKWSFSLLIMLINMAISSHLHRNLHDVIWWVRSTQWFSVERIWTSTVAVCTFHFLFPNWVWITLVEVMDIRKFLIRE